MSDLASNVLSFNLEIIKNISILAVFLFYFFQKCIISVWRNSRHFSFISLSFLFHSSPYYCSLAPASASATSAGSASEPELCFCSAVQHYDDFPAWAAKCAADQHQSAAEQHTTRHHCGHFYTGPTNPVGTQPRLVHQEVPLLKISRLISFEWSLVSFYLFLILVPLPHVILIRFPAGQQLVTKLVTAPMACGAVMVPTSMFMGQVVTAYNPFGGQQVSTNRNEWQNSW